MEPGDRHTRKEEAWQRVDELTAALTDLSEVLSRQEELGRVLQRSVHQVIRAIPGADMVSVTVLRDGTAQTAAASSARVWAIDADQYAAGEGPCLEAARTKKIVRVSVDEIGKRWPQFARNVQGTGVASCLSCPLVIDDEFAGSLNLYRTEPGGFGDLDESLLRLYSTAGTAVIADARRYAEARRLAENLYRALDSRRVIDQAVGVLMTNWRVSAEHAFSYLSRQSQDTNTKLREIAARIVDQARVG